jgi:hypothetical protein
MRRPDIEKSVAECATDQGRADPADSATTDSPEHLPPGSTAVQLGHNRA